jgi:hypothetical protein
MQSISNFLKRRSSISRGPTSPWPSSAISDEGAKPKEKGEMICNTAGRRLRLPAEERSSDIDSSDRTERESGAVCA